MSGLKTDLEYTDQRSGAVSKITTPKGRNQTSPEGAARGTSLVPSQECCNQRYNQASWGCITDCHLVPFYMKD